MERGEHGESVHARSRDLGGRDLVAPGDPVPIAAFNIDDVAVN